MAVNMAYAQSMMGQWVEAHTAYGVHRGILRQVRPDGIVLAMPRGSMVGYRGKSEAESLAEHAFGGDTCTDLDHVQFFRPFFNPFLFFIPFFLLFALRRRDFI